MTRKAWMLAALLVVAGCGANPSTPGAGQNTSEDAWKASIGAPDGKRVEELCRALQNEEYPRLPIIQELGLAAPRSALARDTLLQIFFEQPGNTAWAYPDVLAEALSGLAPSEILKLAAASGGADGKEDSRVEEWVLVLAMMGPKAKSAVPFLEEQLKKHGDNPAAQGGLRAALAVVGGDSRENTEQLRADIAGRAPAGQAAVGILGVLAIRTRMDPSVVEALITWLKVKDAPEAREFEDAYAAAKVLRRLGASSAPALDDIKRLFSRFEEEGGQAAVLFALAVWQIDPTQEDYLRKALGYIGRGDIGCNVGHCEVDFMLRRLNAGEIRAVARMLDDKDRDAARGAVLAFHSFGLRGREAMPALLKVVQSDAPKETREDAVMAVKCVGGEAAGRELEAVGKKEQDSSARVSEIIDAVKAGNVRALRKVLAADPARVNAWTVERVTPLYAAAAEAPIDMVHILLDKGAAVNARASEGGTPLHAAAAHGRKDVAALLIEKGADVNARADDGNAPLHCASTEGFSDVVELLLSKGADVNARGHNEETPLHQAVENDKREIVLLLLAKGAVVDARGWIGRTPLWSAVSMDDREMLELLVSKGADVNARETGGSGDGETVLHRAVHLKRRDMVETLLDKGADVNAATKVLKRTALHRAVEDGDREMVELLLKRGADPNVKDFREPLVRFAAREGKRSIAELLIARGARPDPFTIIALGDGGKLKDLLKADPTLATVKDDGGMTALHWAAYEGQKEVAEILLSAKADANAADELKRTPLHFAAEKEHGNVVEMLLAAGANPNAQDHLGTTPLHWAANQGRRDIAEALLSRGAKTEARNVIGNTPLHGAAEQNQAAVAETLLDKGADVNARGEGGFTPLHHAILKGGETAGVLLAHGASMNAQDDQGKTPLFLAAEWCSKDLVELLVAKGADVNAKDKFGRTPLRRCGAEAPDKRLAEEMRKFLRDHGAKE